MSSESINDALSKEINQANVRGEYLSVSQLESFAHIVREGHKRMDVVTRITNNVKNIVSDAVRALFVEQPQLIALEGNAYTSRQMAACLRDMEIILRYITYAMLAGDTSVLDDPCLNGLSETYLALEVPCNSVISAIQKMKYNAITIANDPNGIAPGDCSNLIAELAGYFDYVAAALGLMNSEVADHLQEEDQGFNISKIDTQEIGPRKFFG
jgi:phycocyanin beta chain